MPIVRAPASLAIRSIASGTSDLRDAVNGCSVLRHSFGEHVHYLVTIAFVFGAVVARDVTRRGVREGRTDAVKDVGAGVAGLAAVRAAGLAAVRAAGPCIRPRFTDGVVFCT